MARIEDFTNPAAGTFQLAVAVDWYEAPAMDYTG